ncbi:FAD/NAD(P)-binding domain-containing protein [Aspergillus heteromorphus CBS 117.55]|uniref:FAD/NAD(P)-binding domain-containing protein n=1 Tax=Aspergillus heteromorphus CBS 117.55 TaxID=1448321 RepID=A0A317WA77_9EURO|nr:FAD/NAD(P)-binding domain-containing protein [Aspergillus heteromorphus CBS 117.55]PWY81898.1 FAD/NAD(P)-binding domain-containing protein [Aspergillus heteromorphus CBS 117.55]
MDAVLSALLQLGQHTLTQQARSPDPLHAEAQSLRTETLAAKYQAERAKRIRADGVAQFQETEGIYRSFQDDPWAAAAAAAAAAAEASQRDTDGDGLRRETTVLIVGGGYAGLVTAVNLRKQGIDDFVIVEKGADFGGTWYWNQYPGVACDVEALHYLPFLEETGYVPRERFASGPEIREHVARIVEQWKLAPRAHLGREITSIHWDAEGSRWDIQTRQGDHFRAAFVVLATGTLHKPKLPGIPGIAEFQRDHFHSSRWQHHCMDGLANKTVGIIGTGASAVQLVPQLARDARHLYVFQRTPSSVARRHNHAPDPVAIAALAPGWQRAQMNDFAQILQGELLDETVDCPALEGLEALTMRAIHADAARLGVDLRSEPEKLAAVYELADFRLMERLRREVEETVHDPAVAERLKPWYAFMCKRPAFHNEYLAAFNRANVELVDTAGAGVSHLTATGVVAAGREYPVDLLIYSTGFEFELGANFYRRTGIHLLGAQGQTLDEKWEARGPSTLFGIHLRDFPNLFHIGPAQAGVTANQLHNIYIAAEHIASVVHMCLTAPAACHRVIQPTAEAEEEWGKHIETGRDMRLAFAQKCPPGYYNQEGRPEEIPARWGVYPAGIVAWERVLKEWRDEGTMKGMEQRLAPFP